MSHLYIFAGGEYSNASQARIATRKVNWHVCLKLVYLTDD